MLKKISSIIIALILLIATFQVVFAQGSIELPVYIVQPGENLTEIAQKFNLSLQELINANNLVDINFISAGTELFIPGLEGVTGILTTQPVGFGDQLLPLLKRNYLSIEDFLKLNPITSPSEIYAGATLVLPQLEEEGSEKSNIILQSNDSLFTTSARENLNPWVFSLENRTQRLKILPGDVLYYQSINSPETVSPFSQSIAKIEVNPLPIQQGQTIEINIYTKQPGIFSGYLGEREIYFFENDEEEFFYSLNGISAIAEPGLMSLNISGALEDGEQFSVEQNLLLIPGGYPQESLSVEQTTVEQPIIEAENEQIQQLLLPVSTEKLWDGNFRFPVDGSLSDGTIAFSSYFGSRRSYNNGQYSGYHGGLDFSVVLMSLNIYAAAPGRVIYAGPMNIRGNTVFIDHGQGVVSGYAHMQEILASPGDLVDRGQIIGLIGKTGRVTGPHLHWDIWVNRVPVDPFNWIDNSYP